jgi:hypothetical protein
MQTMSMDATFSPISSPAPVKDIAEAQGLIAHIAEVMDMLVGVLQQETELVRGGRLSAAGQLQVAKNDLTRHYIADTLRLRASRPQLSQLLPTETLAALHEHHERFRALLQINLTVLATAHAVSEGIIRGVSGEMARKSVPQVYGASGRTVAPTRNAGPPLAVSRML